MSNVQQEQSSENINGSFLNRNIGRRSFFKTAGLTGMGVAGATVLGGRLGLLDHVPGANLLGSPQAVRAATINDADILNFALNLEYLEAEFYSMATYGATLVELGVLTDADTTGPTTGGQMVPGFGKDNIAFLATALREDEISHVKDLRSALGSAAVKKPAINLDAVGFGYTDVGSFLKLSRIFEDVGVSAYLGAAPLISSKTYLATAGAILSVEGFHAGAISLACVWYGVYSPSVDSQDVPPTPQMPFDVNSSALAIPRTTSQVLNIVYSGGQSAGGFYPDGMNGTIHTQ